MNFLCNVLCEVILKDWSFEIFATISILPCQPILAQDQQKREHFITLKF